MTSAVLSDPHSNPLRETQLFPFISGETEAQRKEVTPQCHTAGGSAAGMGAQGPCLLSPTSAHDPGDAPSRSPDCGLDHRPPPPPKGRWPLGRSVILDRWAGPPPACAQFPHQHRGEGAGTETLARRRAARPPRLPPTRPKGCHGSASKGRVK